MIYPEFFEEKIRFDRIRELIKEQCLSSMGKERVDQMRYVTLYDVVSRWVHQTNEFKQICMEESSFPTSYYIDVRGPLNRIKVEGLFLEERELFDLRRSLLSVKDIVRFFKNKEEQNAYPHLREIASKVMVYPYIFERIDAILNKFGKIKDSASPELARIRNEMIKKQGSVSRKMAAILNHARKEGLVETDTNVAIRDGRAVIPVPAGNKRKLNGIIHDESATGKTSFIEPAEIVEINNEIRELEYAERREINRILVAFSDSIRPYLEDLIFSYEFLGIMDFIRAKAKFALQINACLPNMVTYPEVNWEDATHPLLYLQNSVEGKEVVPLSIQLNKEQRIVLISGPNAGGKSVCLQTVGLLQYMFQCGLLVPMDERSTMGIYQHIFIDIGDQQSIENDLSTYSSHLFNMKYFLRHGTPETLILIDEFGTGTEPALGGAIAESVLKRFNTMKMNGVITTHYTNLKHYASGVEGIENGAMQFDTGQIRPLFKLLIGQPGSSFAFEIARKIGLPEELLDSAKERIGEDHINFDKHLREIARDKRYWEQKRDNIRRKDKQLEDVYEKYLTQLEQSKKERQQILEKARREAEELMATANKRIERTIREIKESQAEKERTKKARESLTNFKERLEKSDDKQKHRIEREIERIKNRQKRKEERPDGEALSEKKSKESGSEKKRPTKTSVKDDGMVRKGDKVRLEGQSLPGEVMEITGKNAMVAFGHLITNVKISRLQKISNREVKQAMRSLNQQSLGANMAEQVRKRKLTFKPDIDVRGQRAEEAIQIVTAHIDDAVMCEVGTVKVLHGKGNGILRQMLREMLHTMPHVKSFRDEHIQYGGSGITIVEIDI
ncbi:endonuclease MutS2 [Saccharicrinis fermentans]|uniref:Endonuclease MutS2 n=1 Tax=Saccharicrinis fermentans DSM 9555 = JCM 21142 TaxID=869213 RepID=W7XW60_9BACT|nr:Smr/MutS family protein [Saccharicrinis fermentans]GAF02510.1 MutS2 protein [Saccharicrinis fermentans DSM 9555 = JCM 21142]